MNSKTVFIFAFFSAVLMYGCASPSYTVETEPGGAKIIKGLFDRDVFKNDTLCSWFKYNYDSYALDSASIIEMKPLLNEFHFIVVLGTWCGDSKREVPKQLKIFDVAGVAESKIMIFGVDRSKKSPDGTTDKYNVLRVPTLIVMKGGEEVGRIVENPRTSQEKDLLHLLQK